MRISRSARTATQVAALALSLAGIGAAGATTASAATVHPDSYTCTAANPEVCFSLTQNSGSWTVTEQVHVNSPSSVTFWPTTPAGDGAPVTWSGSGWGSSHSWTWSGIAPHGTYCGDAYVNGSPVVNACLNN
ncbi:hypothetical protein GXW82_21840 [Streptacidiphilus sp. 4-A2]|nr:hypothetical protein [Streptacidiphilus sp. 4-A2]